MLTKNSKAPVGVWPGGVPKPLMPYTPAIKAGGWLFVAGQLASDFETGVAAEAKTENPNIGNQLGLQSRYIMKNLAETVAAAGRDISKDSVRIWQWYTSPYPTNEELKQGINWPRITTTPHIIERDVYIKDPRPASTAMGIKELLVKDTLLEVDLICVDDDDKSVGFKVPDGVPSPLAGYSPAIRRGDWIFLSGEIPTDWKGDFGENVRYGEPSSLAVEARVNPYLWYDSEVERQTEYVMSKLAKIAEEAGTSLSRAVKAEVYIGDPSDFHAMEKVWKRWFPKNPPARVVIPYMGLGGKGNRVEVALTMLANDSKKVIETIRTDKAPKPFSHEPQAVKVDNLLFLSGQLPADENGLLAPGLSRHPNFPYYGQPSRQQMRYMLKNVAAICEAAGTSLENVVRRACFHDHGDSFAEAMDEWAAHFPGLKPVSTTIIVGGPHVVPGAHALLDLIAYVP